MRPYSPRHSQYLSLDFIICTAVVPQYSGNPSQSHNRALASVEESPYRGYHRGMPDPVRTKAEWPLQVKA